MSDIDSEFIQMDVFIFEVIASQQDNGGASLPIITDGVDFFQKIVLTDVELTGGLERLGKVRLVTQRDGKYFVHESVLPLLPRTAAGRVSFRRNEWENLRKRLFKL